LVGFYSRKVEEIERVQKEEEEEELRII